MTPAYYWLDSDFDVCPLCKRKTERQKGKMNLRAKDGSVRESLPVYACSECNSSFLPYITAEVASHYKKIRVDYLPITEIIEIDIVANARKRKQVEEIDEDTLKQEIANFEAEEAKAEAEEAEDEEKAEEATAQGAEIIGNIYEQFVECEQEEIVEAPIESRIFVDAGPGTGKTHTLIERIKNLIIEQDANPKKILVLCYTRAAVAEIKERLRAKTRDGGRRGLNKVEVRTFHSYAWKLIEELNEAEPPKWKSVSCSSLSFDSSLRIAADAFKQYPEEICGEWEHLFVDEVQDLTNERAYLVLEMIKACLAQGCGVTVLGDSCQAIYDYTLRDAKSIKISSFDFYDSLFKMLRDYDCKYLKLTLNHRSTDDIIMKTVDLREAILSLDNEAMKKAAAEFLNVVKESGFNPDTATDATVERLRGGGNICFVTRKNGEMLGLSSLLRKNGVNHRLNIDETNNNYSEWIADVFAEYGKEFITYDIFEERYNNSKHDEEIDAERVWDRMLDIIGEEGDRIRVRDILDALSTYRLDDTVFRTEYRSNVLVSNIHKTKGREYDSVFIDRGFAESLVSGNNPIGEYKTLYVAATRPKTELCTADLAQLNVTKRNYHNSARHVNRSGIAERHKKLPTLIEFKSEKDIVPEQFAELDISSFNDVNAGDEVYLEMKKDDGILYELHHTKTGNLIGWLNSNTIAELRCYAQSNNPDDLPKRINHLYVSGVYSYIVSNEYLEENEELEDYAANGVWKWVEIAGLGEAEY